MKALKEKRVSLRSLFRRSLVILSLLALAFASCAGDSEESGNGNGGPTTPTEPTTPALPDPLTVKSMTVLKHPNMPSYEGAYPDLSGLQVLVTWSDGAEKIVTDASQFTASPPVAFIGGTSGTHRGYSAKGDYYIQYTGDGSWFNVNVNNVYRADLYIPAVIALANNTSGTGGTQITGYPKVVGSIAEFYEDQGINATSLEYAGTYAPFYYGTAATDPYGPASPIGTSGSIPAGSYYTAWNDIYGAGGAGWPSFDQPKFIANKVSSSPEAWVVPRRLSNTTAYKVTYKAGLNQPVSPIAQDDPNVGVDKFYQVDRLEYLSGIEKIPPIGADDANLGGNISTPGVQENWWKVFRDAGLTFKVTYLVDNDDAVKTREITMSDYVRAMYTNDSGGTARSSLPILAGHPTTAANSGVTNSVQDDYNLSVRLFYYDPELKNAAPKGDVDLTTASPGYVTPNAAIIPITESGLIWTFRGIGKIRKDKTAHDGEPEIASGVSVGVNRQSLFDGIKRYWTVVYEYENPRDPSAAPLQVEIPWSAITLSGTSVAAGGYLDFENDVAEEGRELRTATLEVIEPPSTMPTGGTRALGDVEFNYYMLP